MKYRLPTQEDEQLLREYVAEHLAEGEENISPSLGLEKLPFREWLAEMQKNEMEGNAAWGRSICLLCFAEERLIGLLSIRYELSAEQSMIHGDIGYGVRPSERNKGYATQMLRHGLEICREKGLREVVLGCYKDNVASAKTIRKNGGQLILEKDSYTKGRLSQYYRLSCL